MPVSLAHAGEQSLVRVHPDARLDGHVAEQPQAQLGIADGTWVAELCMLMNQVGAELTHDNAWVRVHDVDHLGVMAVMTDGMRRFGLPELRMGSASPDLREELTALLNGVAFRIWSDLLARAHDTPNASLVAGTGQLVQIHWQRSEIRHHAAFRQRVELIGQDVVALPVPFPERGDHTVRAYRRLRVRPHRAPAVGVAGYLLGGGLGPLARGADGTGYFSSVDTGGPGGSSGAAADPGHNGGARATTAAAAAALARGAGSRATPVRWRGLR